MYKFLTFDHKDRDNKPLILNIAPCSLVEMVMHSRRGSLNNHSNLDFLFPSSLLSYPRQTSRLCFLFSSRILLTDKILNVRNVAKSLQNKILIPAGIYLLKVNKGTKRRQWRRSGVLIVNFEYNFQVLTLNMYLSRL